jgi:hypothetical protein
VPHPGHHHEPADRWSDDSTMPGGHVSKIGWLHPRRRAVRLAAAIGVVLGVLCIVLGTLALVVELGPGRPAKPYLTALGHGKYTGSGVGRPQSIRVRGPGPHDVEWNFTCPRGQTGFKMADSGAGLASNPDVNSHDARGSGLWQDLRSGGHGVVIITKCTWHARVFRPSPTPEASSGKHRHAAVGKNPHNKRHGYDKPGHKRNAHHHKHKHSRSPAPAPAPADGA